MDKADDKFFLNPVNGGMSDEVLRIYRDFTNAGSQEEMMAAYEKLPQDIKNALPKTRAGSNRPYSTISTNGTNED